LLILVFLLALFYHLFAGIRHLLMDAGIAEELKSARFSAGLVIVLAFVLTGLMGIYIW
jgi:succinate dehydrogenase / fumarate reductase cytochrome b subunit